MLLQEPQAFAQDNSDLSVLIDLAEVAKTCSRDVRDAPTRYHTRRLGETYALPLEASPPCGISNSLLLLGAGAGWCPPLSIRNNRRGKRGYGKMNSSIIIIEELTRRVVSLEERIGGLNQTSVSPTEVEVLATDLDIVWIIISAIMVFFMQVGFAMVRLTLRRGRDNM